MKTLTTKQLIELTPLDEAVKKEALEKLPQMNETEIMNFEQVCWDLIAKICQLEISARIDQAITDLATKGGEDTVNADKIESDVITEFFGKTDTITTEDQLEEIKTYLQKEIAQTKTATLNMPTAPIIN